MDVMKPKLMWIEGRCYRFFESNSWSSKDHSSIPYTEDSNPEEFCDLNDDCCPNDIDIVLLGGAYTHSFYVPSIFYKFLIGVNGTYKKKLESETKTSITIPRMGKDGNIVLTASNQTAIISARHRIDLTIENSRKKLKPTHFLAVPMNIRTIAENFQNFKLGVLNDIANDSNGIREELFQIPEKMHLTLGMLLLLDEDEIKSASCTLHECNDKILRPIMEKAGTITIKIQGLECMNDDPTSVAVIYGDVTSDGNILQEISEKTVDFFVEKGLMKRERDTIKLHMTLMNASFPVNRKATKFRRVEKFQATDVLKMYKDHYFGERILDTIQLCRISTNAEDGYYVVESKINLI